MKAEDIQPSEKPASVAFPSETETSAIAQFEAATPLPTAHTVTDPHSPDNLPTSVGTNPGDAISAVPKRFQYGLRLNIRSVYDDNIFLNKENGAGPVSDLYFAIEPGLTFGFGDVVGRSPNFLRLDYAPSVFLYLDHSEANAIQHLVRLEGQYRLGHLALGLSQDILLLEGANPESISSFTSGVNATPLANLDAGGNTEVNTYTTNATFSYDLTGKTFLSGALNYSVNDYQDLLSSTIISGNVFLNYDYSPKLVVGLGGTGGYDLVDAPSPDQTFEQINLRLSYQLSGKVSLNASGGVEYRQFENDSQRGNYASPVYQLDASYQPFDGTTVTLSGSRRTQNSAVFVGQDYASTNITLGLRQRLLRRIYLGLVVGYENSDYFTTIQGIDASRNDNYFFVQPAVDFAMMRFWTVGAYYLHRQDNSSNDSFSFSDNQVGLRTSLTF